MSCRGERYDSYESQIEWLQTVYQNSAGKKSVPGPILKNGLEQWNPEILEKIHPSGT